MASGSRIRRNRAARSAGRARRPGCGQTRSIQVGLSFAYRAKGDAAQQVLAQREGDDHDGHQEEQHARRDGAPLALPVPTIEVMLGGAVRARSLVSIRAKAYSFQAKIRQKTVVAAMPVTACGSTILKNACQRL